MHWETRHQGQGALLWRFYQTLLGLRSQLITASPSQPTPRAQITGPQGLIPWQPGPGVLILINVQPWGVSYRPRVDGPWQQQLNSADAEWLGPGGCGPDPLTPGSEVCLWPHSVVVYRRLEEPARQIPTPSDAPLQPW